MIFGALYTTYFFGKIPQLLYAKKTYLITGLTLINIFLNIGLNLYMIPLYGLNGAVFATFSSGVISGGLSFYYSQKYTPISWDYMFLFLVISFLLLSIVTVIYSRYYEFNYIYLLLLKFLIILMYFFLGLYYKIDFKLKY